MLQEKVARLRQLMSEAVPKETTADSAEAQSLRLFQLYEFNSAPPLLVAEQTPRARTEREIERIASWYGWAGEIVRALDSAGVSTLGGLPEARLDVLHSRMQQLEDCVREGLDCPDSPPAR